MHGDVLFFKQQRFPILINGQELKSTVSERDLDVIFSNQY